MRAKPHACWDQGESVAVRAASREPLQSAPRVHGYEAEDGAEVGKTRNSGAKRMVFAKHLLPRDAAGCGAHHAVEQCMSELMPARGAPKPADVAFVALQIVHAASSV